MKYCPTSQVHSQKRETETLRRWKENLTVVKRGDIRAGRLLQLQKTLPRFGSGLLLFRANLLVPSLLVFNHCYSVYPFMCTSDVILDIDWQF